MSILDNGALCSCLIMLITVEAAGWEGQWWNQWSEYQLCIRDVQTHYDLGKISVGPRVNHAFALLVSLSAKRSWKLYLCHANQAYGIITHIRKSVSKEDSTKQSFIHSLIHSASIYYLYSDSPGSILAFWSSLNVFRSSLWGLEDAHAYATHMRCVTSQCAAMRV